MLDIGVFGDQRLDAVIVDQAGDTATVRATHTGGAPGCLDSLAAVLDGEEGELRFVSGVVGRTAGGVVIEPLGLAVGGRVVVPDLQPAGGSGRLMGAEDDRLAAAARRLTVLGLHRIAQAVTAFAETRTDDSDEAVEQAWVDAYLRLEVALDLN
ncbi:hypothetical protein [Microbispora sp. KK1-11]|uniref:hypothetical protein n=1 Tax=Microbispora sp. KK1-11 TaxID=2053005 RepID=UPI00115AD0FA|nr:hypothetical protein [Microbispora sp. KK1-11]TQS26419.1 hypothetical protein FLW16_25560 [Microbispora sp. KK1-11]